MDYNQQFDFGNERVPPNPHPRAYANPQQYRGERNHYNERPPHTQQYDSYDHESMQQPQDYGYRRDEGYGVGRGYYADRYHKGSPSDRNRGPRIPPAQYEAGGYNGEATRQPMQQPQQWEFDPRHRGTPDSPAPRSAGQTQQSSRQYLQDRAHEPKHYQGRRPQHNGVSMPARDDYHVENGYGRSDDYNYARPGNPQQQPYLPGNGWQQQSHRRGRPNGYEEQGCYDDQNGAVPHDPREDFAAQRPRRDQQRSQSNGRQNLDKRKIFADPRSPDTVSWDNPFPTFPAGKKKEMQDDGDVPRSMADTRVSDKTQHNPDSRPQTANSRDIYSRERPQHGHDGTQSRSQQSNWDSRGAAQTPPRFQETPVREIERLHADYSRSRPSTGRRSEEASRGVTKSNAGFQPDAERSRTMPNDVSSAVLRSGAPKEYGSPSKWQEPGPTAGYYGPEDKAYLPDRPSTASGSRPPGPVRSRSKEISRLRDTQTSTQQVNAILSPENTRDRPPVSRQDSVADVYDSYYDGSTPVSPDQHYRGYNAYQPPIEKEMPRFNAAPTSSSSHQRGMTIDDHLQPQQSSPEMPPIPGQYQRQHVAAFDRSQAHDQVPRSRSQPDLKNRRPPRVQPNDGFDFGIPPQASAIPSRPYRQNDTWVPRQYPPEEPSARPAYDRQQGASQGIPPQPPAPYSANGGPRPAEPYPQHFSNQAPPDQYRPLIQQRPSPNGQTRGPGGRPSPDSRVGPTSPPASLPMQPDALPSHPAPIRAGLMSNTSPIQPPKPIPVRNYNSNSSPLQNFSLAQAPSSSQAAEGKGPPAPTTQDELERLRQTMKANPSDQKTQLTLARKLMEAAAALDEGVPRTDQKTIQKTRERYYAEAHKIVKRLVSTGNTDGMFFLGDCYSQGRLGLEKDTKEAFTLYQSAAKAGHAQAAFRVAVCCELGLEEDGGTKRDLGKAVQWYKRAAQLGDTPAMYKTGVIQLKGLLGQPKDTGEAVIWLRRAAEKADKDNPHALHELVSHRARGKPQTLSCFCKL